MSDSLVSLRRKIEGAGDLESVVRSMKAIAAASIGQYENSVQALADYYRTLELGLAVCLRQRSATDHPEPPATTSNTISAIVFGSDMGLVGQFNEVLADFVGKSLDSLPGDKQVWVVGERMHSRLADIGIIPVGRFALPTSVNAITPLVGRILVDTEPNRSRSEIGQFYLFHNCPQVGSAYEPVRRRMLPLDDHWAQRIAHLSWPSRNLPEVIGDAEQTLRALVREYLFVSLYKTCAESLASENASRLAAMQRAEKNIEELVVELNQHYCQLRQNSIDEELFDVLSAYESLSKAKKSQEMQP